MFSLQKEHMNQRCKHLVMLMHDVWMSIPNSRDYPGKTKIKTIKMVDLCYKKCEILL